MNRLTIDDINRDIEKEKKSAEVITEDVFAKLREFKQAGISLSELSETMSALDHFANHATKSLGPVSRKESLPSPATARPSNLTDSGRYNKPPIAKSGGGGDNGDMEARIARVESDMTHISKTLDEVKLDVREIRKDIQEVRKEATRDYRTLFAALISVAIGLAGLMAKGFQWV